MGLFKSKEEKLALLNIKLGELKEKYKEFSNSLMLIGDYVFVLKRFAIDDNEIVIHYEDKNTPAGHYNIKALWVWRAQYGDDFKKFRKNWIYFKDSLNKLGVDLTIRE